MSPTTDSNTAATTWQVVWLHQGTGQKTGTAGTSLLSAMQSPVAPVGRSWWCSRVSSNVWLLPDFLQPYKLATGRVDLLCDKTNDWKRYISKDCTIKASRYHSLMAPYCLKTVWRQILLTEYQLLQLKLGEFLPSQQIRPWQQVHLKIKSTKQHFLLLWCITLHIIALFL